MEKYADELKRWFKISVFRIEEPEERKVAVFLKNITERKQAPKEWEQLLREVQTERERLTDIFQHAPSFMCVLRGPGHVFERANALHRKMIGEDRDFVYQPIREADGSISGVFAQGVDLTERVHAQKELKAMNETLEKRVEERTKSLLSYQNQLRSLASQLSKAEEKQRQQLASELHDNLAQLLAVSKMKVDLLEKEQFSREGESGIEELKELMNDALSYIRELMTELKPPPPIGEDIMASIEWIAEKMEKNGLDITIEDDGRPKPLEEEVRKTLLQCIRELLFNIVKHTSEKEATYV